MNPIVIVEGFTDNLILHALLPYRLHKGAKFLIAGDRTSLPSIARTLLVTAHRPIAALVDTDSIEETVVQEKVRTTEDLLKSVAGKLPVKVIPFIPTIEIIFFERPKILERIFGIEVKSELLLVARHDPKDAIAQLLESGGQRRQIGWLLDHFTDNDKEALRSTKPIHELIEFLSPLIASQKPA